MYSKLCAVFLILEGTRETSRKLGKKLIRYAAINELGILNKGPLQWVSEPASPMLFDEYAY